MKSTPFNYVSDLVADKLRQDAERNREERGTKREYFYASDGLLYNKGSSKCLRQLWYEFSDVEPEIKDDETLKTLELGNVVHDWLQNLLLKTGRVISVEGRQVFYNPDGTWTLSPDSQKTIIAKPVKISGRPDLKMNIVTKDGKVKPCVVEIKSIKNSNFMYNFRNDKVKMRPKDNHYQQIQFYLHADKYDVGILVYVNKETGEMQEFFIEYDERYVHQNMALYKKAMKVVKGDIPERIAKERPKTTRDGWQCFYCDYAETCWGNKDGKTDN